MFETDLELFSYRTQCGNESLAWLDVVMAKTQKERTKAYNKWLSIHNRVKNLCAKIEKRLRGK